MTPAEIPAALNLAAYVLGAGRRTPDKLALAILGPDTAEHWSYARLTAAVEGTATGLLRHGLTRGDRLLLQLGNTADFPVAFLGAIAAGILPVPTSSQLTQREISAITRDIGPRAIVAGPGVALPDDPPDVISQAQLHGFQDLPASGIDMGDPQRPAYIIYTSGTSGQPRAVVHAHRAILARAMMFDGWSGLTPEDRLLHAGAFNWTYTLGTGLMDPWTMGATALIPAAGTGAEALARLLQEHDASIFAAAPGVFRQMLRHPVSELARLRHGLSAGEKLTEALRAKWRSATGTEVHEAYGMSECSTFISSSPAHPAPPGTLGFVQPGRRIELRVNGAASDTGVIAVHRSDPGLMLGYLDQPAETTARFDGDWFLTGDIGRKTAQGAIAYEGRADDMMNAGGYRVSPVEVEDVLGHHPGIAEAAAVEVRIKSDATVIAAFWTGPAPIDPATLQAFAAERLARYKCPRLFIQVPSLPRGTNNKLLRKTLRQDWETTHGQA